MVLSLHLLLGQAVISLAYAFHKSNKIISLFDLAFIMLYSDSL
jgi:hypothetical protein